MSGSNMTNSNITATGTGVVITGKINFINNKIISSSTGISLTGSGISISNSSVVAEGVGINAGSNNNVSNNIITSSGDSGIVLGSNNNITNNNITTISGTTIYGIYGSGAASYNNILDNYITSPRGIYFLASVGSNKAVGHNISGNNMTGYINFKTNAVGNQAVNNTLANNQVSQIIFSGSGPITDNLISNTIMSTSIGISSGALSGINNFTNCTFTDASITGASSINVFWYADTYTNDSSGNPLEDVNITIKNVAGNLINYSLTNSSGYTERVTLREYMQNATAQYFDTNYTFKASKSGYAILNKYINLTNNSIADDGTQIFFEMQEGLTACQNITSPGIYTLLSNITSIGTCFNITSSDVIIECQEYTINYSNASEGQGIWTNSSDVTVFNCNINKGSAQSNSYDLYVASGEINITNSTFNKSNAYSNGLLNTFWYVNLYVNDSASQNVTNANVSTYDIYNNLFNWSMTTSDGRIPTLTLREYIQNSSGIYFDTNYTFNADKNRYHSELSYNVTSSLEYPNNLYLTLPTTDTDMPTVVTNTPISGTVTRNNTITVNCSFTDNIQLANVTLYSDWSGVWEINQTWDISGTENSTSATWDLLNGTYSWKCQVCDNSSNCVSQSINNSFMIIPVDQPVWTALHNTHTTFSDGGFSQTTAVSANKDNFDAGATNDHDYSLSQEEWTSMINTANGNNTDNNLTYFFGVEWTSTFHIFYISLNPTPTVKTKNDDDFNTVQEIAAWLEQTQGLAVYAHPAQYFSLDWNNPALVNDTWIPLVDLKNKAGTWHWNYFWNCSAYAETLGCVNYTNPYTPTNDPTNAFVKEALDLGYHFGFVCSNDDHTVPFTYGCGIGLVNPYNWTREGIYETLKERHTWAAEKKTMISVIVNNGTSNYTMGDIFKTNLSTIYLDYDILASPNTTISRINLFHNGIIVNLTNETQTRAKGSFPVTLTGGGDEDYIFLEVIQADNARAWSSPVYVEYDTLDIIDPTAVQGTNPVDDYNSISSSITFDMKCSDDREVGTIQLWTNTTGIWHANYSNSAYTNDTWLNISITGILDGSNYKWAIWCNDSTGNENITDNRTFNVSVVFDTTDPIAYFGTNPIDTYNTTSSSITFDLKCSDNLAVDTIQLWGNWSGTWQTNYTNSSYTNDTWLNITKTIPDGTYKWAVYCNDTSGLEDWTDTNRTFDVDLTIPSNDPPSVTLNSPEDETTDTDGNVTFNCSATDDQQLVNLTLYVWNSIGLYYNNTVDIAETENSSSWDLTNIPEEDYEWNCLAYDNASQSSWATSNRTLTVNTTEIPETFGVNLNYPDNEALINNDQPDFNFTVLSETNSTNISCELFINNTGYGFNNTVENNTETTITTNDTLDDGLYSWYVNCTDLAGTNQSETRTFTIDTQEPEINLISPEDNHNFASGTTHITFSWDVTDNLDTNISCNVYTQDSYQETIYCENATACEQTISGFSPGSYSYEVNCSDGINQKVLDSRDFSIRHSSGSGGGGTTTPTNETNATNNTEPSGYNHTLDDLNEPRLVGVGLNEVLRFSMAGENHTLKVIALTEDSVTLMIWSSPLQVTLNVGETKQLDLNEDGDNDLEITFNGLVDGKADLLLTEIKSPVCGDGICVVEEADSCCQDCGCQTGYECKNNTCEVINNPESGSTNSVKIWICIIVSIVIIALLVYVIASATARKKRGY